MGSATSGQQAVETVVVGIGDLSDAGEALVAAVVRSRTTPVRLHLVHAYRDLAQVWLSGDALTAVEPLRQSCETRLAELAACLGEGADRVEYHARPGKPASVLVSVANEQHAQSIVIGASRRRVSVWRSGGIVRQLARCSACPVLVVPVFSLTEVATTSGA